MIRRARLQQGAILIPEVRGDDLSHGLPGGIMAHRWEMPEVDTQCSVVGRKVFPLSP